MTGGHTQDAVCAHLCGSVQPVRLSELASARRTRLEWLVTEGVITGVVDLHQEWAQVPRALADTFPKGTLDLDSCFVVVRHLQKLTPAQRCANRFNSRRASRTSQNIYCPLRVRVSGTKSGNGVGTGVALMVSGGIGSDT